MVHILPLFDERKEKLDNFILIYLHFFLNTPKIGQNCPAHVSPPMWGQVPLLKCLLNTQFSFLIHTSSDYSPKYKKSSN